MLRCEHSLPASGSGVPASGSTCKIGPLPPSARPAEPGESAPLAPAALPALPPLLLLPPPAEVLFAPALPTALPARCESLLQPRSAVALISDTLSKRANTTRSVASLQGDSPLQRATRSGPVREEPRAVASKRNSTLSASSRSGLRRRRRDSNPRYPCEYAGFQNRCLKPLGHSSKVAEVLGSSLDSIRSRARHVPRGG